jgi:high affinity Mn2+ porin
MNVLSDHGLHNIQDESWNGYGQFTYIGGYHPAFSAPYTNANGSINSLVPDADYSFTGSFTLFFGVRLWPGAEAYLVPEVISERPFSALRGLGGAIQDFELQKTGSVTPQLYRSRTYLRQRINLGGSHVEKASQPMQLAATVDSRRLVLTAGTFSVLDMFDHNDVTGDPRQTFLNMAFMTYASWDFPADARGYTDGGTAELYWDSLTFRAGWFMPPLLPNQLPLEPRIWKYYGLAFELEHDHEILGQAGAVRLLAYRNRVFSGAFADAIQVFEEDPSKNAANCGTNFNYGSGNVSAPDLCWVRQTNIKVGIGTDLEQFVAKDVGLFVRGMYSDGRSEVDAFNAADRSLAFGSVAKGTLWNRPFDVTGIGFGMSWISNVHAQYLAMGGVDGFVGDGHLRQAGEGVTDVFYSYNLLKAVWLTADYQFLWHPGYNADRGPVNILGGRVHAEF